MVNYIVPIVIISVSLQSNQLASLCENSNAHDEGSPKVRLSLPVYSSGSTGSTLSLLSADICYPEGCSTPIIDDASEKDTGRGTGFVTGHCKMVNRIFISSIQELHKLNIRPEPILKRKRYPGRR